MNISAKKPPQPIPTLAFVLRLFREKPDLFGGFMWGLSIERVAAAGPFVACSVHLIKTCSPWFGSAGAVLFSAVRTKGRRMMAEKQIAVVLIADLSKVGSEIEKQLKKVLAPAEKVGESIGQKLTKGFTKQTVAFSKSGHRMAQSFTQATGPMDRVIANFSAGFSDARQVASAFTGVAGRLGGAARTSAAAAEKGFDDLSKAIDNTAVRVGSGLGRGMLNMGKAGCRAFQNASEGARILSIAGVVALQTYDGFVPRLKALAKVGGQAVDALGAAILAVDDRATGFVRNVSVAAVKRMGEFWGSIRNGFQSGLKSLKNFHENFKQVWKEIGGFKGLPRDLRNDMRAGVSAAVTAVGGFKGVVSGLWNVMRAGVLRPSPHSVGSGPRSPTPSTS
jgi:hypothetical protein